MNLILSFLAGLLLNFMPCVLPIILIKIYDIVKQTENRSNLRLASLGSVIGVVSTFLVFSTIAVVFKYFDKNFNLGFHFQNPYFLIAMIVLLILFMLNLFNVFNIGYSQKIITFIQGRYEKSKNAEIGVFFANFLTAIFMVLFATPCSIPIIGTTTAFSITENSYFSIVSIFLAMGFGMSLPFIFILFYPNILDFLKNKKRFLGLIRYIVIAALLLTIIWLLYVLKVTLGLKSLIVLTGFLVVLVLQFFIIKKPIQSMVMVLVISFFAIVMPVQVFKEDMAKKISETLWRAFITKEEVKNLVDNDKTIFISITAKWCMICNLNDITLFSKHKVLEYLNRENNIAIRIDLTQDSELAKEFYDNSGGFYVPKYIIFNKNNPNGCSFTGQLTEKRFFNEVNTCK